MKSGPTYRDARLKTSPPCRPAKQGRALLVRPARHSRRRELRDRRRVLFPIRLAPFETLRAWERFDANTGKDSAREIREYFIPDFSHWKNHDSYQEAFQSLIRDLKASDAKPK
jgi:hypothetical protein